MPQSKMGVVDDIEQLRTWMKQGHLFVMDSTGFADGNPWSESKVDFDTNIQRGRNVLASAAGAYAVNLASVRSGTDRVTSLPFRNEPPYDHEALEAFARARQTWRDHPTEAIQAVHLLVGLLLVEGGTTHRFFDALSDETGNPLVRADDLLGFLRAALLKMEARAEDYAETSTFAAVKASAGNEVRRRNDVAVSDLHLLMALLRAPGASVTKALAQRRTSPQECLSYLDALHPTVYTTARSTFPSAPGAGSAGG
jgi:hypothetical protein